MSKSSTSLKLKALMWKHCLVRKRRWLLSLLEIVIPAYIAINIIFTQGSDLKQHYINLTEYPRYTETELYTEFLDHRVKMYYAPTTLFNQQLANATFRKVKLGFKAFESVSDLDKYFNVVEEPQAWSVVFETEGKLPKKCSYIIRPYKRDFLWEIDKLFSPTGSQKYMEQSLLAIQMAIDTTYLSIITQSKKIKNELNFNVEQFPYPPYWYKENTHRMQRILRHTIMFAYAFLCPIILHRIVRHQRTGLKELMKVVGVESWMLWFAWFLNFFVLNLIVIAIIVLFLVLPLSENAPFDDANAGIIMLFHVLYGASAITFMFALSTISTRPLIAMIVGTFTWIVSFYIPVGIIKYNPSLPWTNRLFMLLIPNACLFFGYEEIINYGEKNIAMTWKYVGKYDEDTGNVTLSNVLTMLVVDCFLYFLIAMYIESIKPNRYGTTRPMTFSCQNLCNWVLPCFEHDDDDEDDDEDNKETHHFSKKIEGQPDLPAKIMIRSLVKEYKHVTAVNALSMNVLEKKVTVLTGHNGAGKTTILNVIAGFTDADGGTISIDNKDIKNNKEACIGYCPHDNLIFSHLTVVEHLMVFGMLRGLTKAEAEFEANDLIFRLGIHLQRLNLGSSIYGGTKRKIALGIAFIGNPEIMLLDEPTVGLDPESCRLIWDLILTSKGEKTFLITTHSMEEAELLGDQIAILDHGALVCLGSPNYLKQEFAVNYSLVLNYSVQTNATEIDRSNKVKQIMKLVTNIIPSAVLQSDKKNKLTILLPHDAKPLFTKLFQTLEPAKAKLDVTNIELYVDTTLEDVVSRFEHALEDKVTEEDYKYKEDEMVRKCIEQSSKIRKENRKTSLQIKGLLRKRLYETERCWKLYLFVLLLTLLATLLTVDLENNWSDISDPIDTFYFDLSAYSSTTVYYSETHRTDFGAKLANKYSKIVSEQNTKVVEVDKLPYAVMKVKNYNYKSLAVGAEIVDYSYGKTKKAVVNIMHSNNATHGAPISLNLVMNALLRTLAGDDYSIVTGIKPYENIKTVYIENNSAYFTFWATLFPLGLLLFSAMFLMIPMYEKSLRYKQLQLISGVRPMVYWGSHYLWDYFLFFVMMLLTLLVICLYGIAYDIPYSTTYAIITLTSILIVYGLSIIPYTYLFSFTQVASEGFLSFIIINLVISMMLLYHFVFYDANYQYPKAADFFKHILFLYPQFGLTYASLKFSRQATWNFNWQIMSEEERDSVCRLDYNPCCEYNISICDKYQSYFTGNHGVQNIIIIMFCSAFLYIIIICIIELQITRRLLDRVINFYDRYNLSMVNKVRRYDAIWEQRRAETNFIVERSNPRAIIHSYEIYQKADLFLAWNLQKHYNNVRVVSGISFGIKPGECLGLVGVNGVGKTTIFRILTGDLPLVSGDARIHYEKRLTYLSRDRINYLASIGYCPQLNSVLDMLTGRELLRISAILCGVRKNLGRVVIVWLKVFGLKEYADVLSKNYSEGSRRKLCLAMALIGNPLLILLDEPTNHVDLGSRRKLWSILNLYLNNETNPSSLIMSSHLMDECETMCNKVAIMKRGRFDCFGVIPKIQEKYGDGFIITLYIKAQQNVETNPVGNVDPSFKVIVVPGLQKDSQELKNLLNEFEKMFKGVYILLDKFPIMLRYRIISYLLTWSDLFTRLEKLKTNHRIIEDYVIHTTSLEETFLSVART